MATFEKLLTCAQANQRCVIARNNTERKALRRHFQAGELLEPYPGLYAEPGAWNGLSVCQQLNYMLRALACIHPNWTFAGLSAVAAFGLQCRLGLYDVDRRIYIATNTCNGSNKANHLQYVRMPVVPRARGDGVYVTNPARTLVDCALRYDFRDVLPMADSALRLGLVTKEDIAQVASLLKRCRDRIKVNRLLQYADPASENGGESLCRATMLEAGFPVPRLQVEHRIMHQGGSRFRTDFEFTAFDGHLVIVEFDGMGKFIDADMTGGMSTRAVVHQERVRERALEGVTGARIVRLDFQQVMQRTPVTQALLMAGVPLTGPMHVTV